MGNFSLNYTIPEDECVAGNQITSNRGNIVVNEESTYVTFDANIVSVDAPSAKNINVDGADDAFHHYSSTAAVGRVEDFDGPGQIFRNLQESPGLGDDSQNVIPHGGEVSMKFIGTVETYTNPSEMTVVNITTPNHFFADGVVSRQLHELDGCYVVTTSGIGTGKLGGINSLASARSWDGDTKDIAEETVVDELMGQRSPDPRLIPEDMSENIRTSGTEPMNLTDVVNELRDTHAEIWEKEGPDALENRVFQALSHENTGRMFKALDEAGITEVEISKDLSEDVSERASSLMQGAYESFHENSLTIYNSEEIHLSHQSEPELSIPEEDYSAGH